MKCALVMIAASTACVAMSSSAASAALIASDNYESGGISYGAGAGTGLGVHTDLGGSGGIFSQTGSRRIDGAASLGSFSGGSSEELGRTVTGSIDGLPTLRYSFSMRADIPNSNSTLKGGNIKSTAGLGANFGANEMLSIGITSATNNGVLVTGTTTQTIPLGTSDVRGSIIDFTVEWDRTSGAYTATAAVRGGASGSVSGTLKTSGPYLPGALGFIHSDVGGGGNDVMFDNLLLQTIPEPTTLGILAGAGLLALRRRK